MRATVMSRRTLMGSAPWAVVAVASVPEIAAAHAAAALSAKNETTVRNYYKGWERKDWRAFDQLLTEDFTFSSPLDAHINKSAFKKGCWDTQIAYIGRFDLKLVAGTGDEVLVLYLGHTSNNKTFQNVEYLRLKGEQVQEVQCYFGAQNSFTSAVATQK